MEPEVRLVFEGELFLIPITPLYLKCQIFKANPVLLDAQSAHLPAMRTISWAAVRH
jgi:hypothetical protein